MAKTAKKAAAKKAATKPATTTAAQPPEGTSPTNGPDDQGAPGDGATKAAVNTNDVKAENLKDAAIQAFTDNPQCDELYLCGDGMPFYREHDARNHERDLGPNHRGVVRFVRAETMPEA